MLKRIHPRPQTARNRQLTSNLNSGCRDACVDKNLYSKVKLDLSHVIISYQYFWANGMVNWQWCTLASNNKTPPGVAQPKIRWWFQHVSTHPKNIHQNDVINIPSFKVKTKHVNDTTIIYSILNMCGLSI